MSARSFSRYRCFKDLLEQANRVDFLYMEEAEAESLISGLIEDRIKTDSSTPAAYLRKSLLAHYFSNSK